MDIVMAKIKQEEEEDEEEAMLRKIAESLNPKWQGANATGEQLAHVKEVEIQKSLQESELTLNTKGHKTELAYYRNRKIVEKELQTKLIDVEKKEAAIDHIIEKLVEKEKKLEKRLEKCKKKEENNRRKDKDLKEKVNFLREEEKSLENEKKIIVSDRENLFNLKTEVNQMKAEVEARQLKISEETDLLNPTEEERLKLLQLEELLILCREGCELQCKLKNEIQEYTAQKELLLKENEQLRQVRKNLEEKESEIDKDLIIITEQKQRFEELKHSEEEHLRQKKRQAELVHIEKELNALERSKRSFASSMDSEKAVICEKIQNIRCEMLQEFSELKEQLVSELQSKLKYESEQYRLKKELLRKETEQLKQERINLDEKLSEIERGLIDVNGQKQRFENLKQSEEEYLKQEKLATQEYIQREFDALERSRKSFASMMDHEKTVISERIQNSRCQMLLEFSELKEQLENELVSKLKHESEQCRLQKELLAEESEQLKQERVNLDEKLSELRKGLIDLNEQKQKLENLKHTEEENLKQQKLATQEYLQRELDALKVSKENIEKHRVQMCNELQKRQCENEVQSKLERETEVCLLQKELLLKENEDLRQRKKAFDLYLGEMDKKQSQIQEQLIDLRDQRDKFEQQKTSEVERLKQEKLAAEEYKWREFDAVKLYKEKIQNERSKMLHELKLWKKQLENEMEGKREEMEKQFVVREKLVERREKEVNTIKYLREKEVNTIKYLRELVRGEMQEIKQERLKIEGHHFQMCKDIDYLKSHKRKLMVQLKQFLKDRENFSSFLHRVKMLPVALGSGSAVSGYRNGTSEMSNLPLLVANETVLPIILGSDSAVCGSRNGTSDICSLPPVMVNECSPRIVEIEDIHDPPADDDIDVHKKQDVAKDLHSSHLENTESTVLSAVVQDSKEIMEKTMDHDQQKCLNSDVDHLICIPSKSHTESSVVDAVLVANGGGDSSDRSLLTDAKKSSKKRRRVTPDSSVADQNQDLTSLTLTDSNNGSMAGVDCGSLDQKDINLQRNYAKQSENAACGGNQEVSATRKSKRQRRISQVLEDYDLEYFV